jgi:hypothetical protein
MAFNFIGMTLLFVQSVTAFSQYCHYGFAHHDFNFYLNVPKATGYPERQSSTLNPVFISVL